MLHWWCSACTRFSSLAWFLVMVAILRVPCVFSCLLGEFTKPNCLFTVTLRAQKNCTLGITEVDEVFMELPLSGIGRGARADRALGGACSKVILVPAAAPSQGLLQRAAYGLCLAAAHERSSPSIFSMTMPQAGH